MAKKAKENTTAAPTNGEPTTVDAVLASIYTDPEDSGRSFRFGDLPPRSLFRLLTKGCNEILRDSSAMDRETVAKAKAEGTLETIRAEAREKRWNSLVSGEFSVGVRGPRVPESVRVYNECLEETFVANFWDPQRKAGAKARKADGTEVALPAFSAVKATRQAEFLADWAGKESAHEPGRTNGDVAREEADRRIARMSGVKADVAKVTGPITL